MRQRVVLPKQLHVGRQPVEGGAGEVKLNHLKPDALWTSTFDTAWKTGWPWWLESEGYDYGWPYHEDEIGDRDVSIGWLLTPRECDVWQIDNAAEARQFLDTYGVDIGAIRGYLLVDWPKVTEDGVDAIRLTCPYDHDVRFGLGIVFYGWDCESTAWLTWQFDRVEGIVLPDLEPSEFDDEEEEVGAEDH